MRNILIGTVLTAGVLLSGCQTTNTGICKICHPQEAAQAQAQTPRENPIMKIDAWMQEHMW